MSCIPASLWRIIATLALSCLLSACALPKHEPNHVELKAVYNAAIEDARIAEPHEINKNLVAVVPSNPALIWQKKERQNPYVLVATWTDYDGYASKVGQEMTLAIDIWVTAVPEMKDFCKELDDNLTVRLEQVLGLPPNSGYGKVVEIWVQPQDLFRPSADPEISDSQAEIDFRIANKFMNISEEYLDWFNKQKKDSYKPDGYPWTRLGYTYDWGNPKEHVGLSEFIISKGSRVHIHSLASTAEYCR